MLLMAASLHLVSPPLQGSLDEDAGEESASFDLWCNYFRRQFPELTVDRIKEFEATYRGSSEERADVLQAYAGALAMVWLTCLLCADHLD